MKITTPLALALVASLYLCPTASAAEHAEHDTHATHHEASKAQAKEEDKGRDKDNTGMNKRDREAGAATAGSQSNKKSDMHITTEIRRAITKDKSMSMNARNVKVITKEGKVTLKGPVADAEQKKAIEEKAEEIAGAGMVTSELEVKEKK